MSTGNVDLNKDVAMSSQTKAQVEELYNNIPDSVKAKIKEVAKSVSPEEFAGFIASAASNIESDDISQRADTLLKLKLALLQKSIPTQDQISLFVGLASKAVPIAEIKKLISYVQNMSPADQKKLEDFIKNKLKNVDPKQVAANLKQFVETEAKVDGKIIKDALPDDIGQKLKELYQELPQDTKDKIEKVKNNVSPEEFEDYVKNILKNTPPQEIAEKAIALLNLKNLVVRAAFPIALQKDLIKAINKLPAGTVDKIKKAIDNITPEDLEKAEGKIEDLLATTPPDQIPEKVASYLESLKK